MALFCDIICGSGDIMSKGKKLVLLFCFIIFDLFLLVGFLIIRDFTEENKLKKEILALTKLDITKDRYNLEIKSSGSYGIVESAIKEYLDDYAVNLQSVLGIINDSQFSKLLSVSNYEEDGPEFASSLTYIDKSQEQFNSDIMMLIEDCDVTKIEGYISDKLSNEYYISLYKELMIDTNMDDDFIKTKTILEDTQNEVNTIFDTSRETLNFLKIHSSEWKIEDNQIKFQTVELVNQYNELISHIK